MGAASSTEGEREPLIFPPNPETSIQPVYSRVYGRRWLVLTLFSLLAFMQGMVWNTWGPIQNSAIHAYDFAKSDIAVLVLWGPVGFTPWLLFMWLMDKKGELFCSRWQYVFTIVCLHCQIIFPQGCVIACCSDLGIVDVYILGKKEKVLMTRYHRS